MNKRLQQFGVLKQRYMHDLRMHAEVFRACAILTYLTIDDGDKLFDCGYNDHYTHSRGERRIYSYSGEESDEKSNDGISLLFVIKTRVISSCGERSSGFDGSTTINTGVSSGCGVGLLSLISEMNY